jgi:hypothetical protein
MPHNFKDLVGIFLDLINTATPVLGGIALLVFLRGLAKFIRNSGDEGSHEDGKNLMLWGVIALFVLFALWGIVQFGQHSVGITRPFGIPILPTAN